MSRYRSVKRRAALLDASLTRLRRANHYGFLLTVLGLFLYYVPPLCLLFLALGLSTLLAVAVLEGPYLLFRRVQIQMHELMALVAVTSGLWAFIFQELVGDRGAYANAPLAVALCALVAVWMLRGAAWGLWVAKWLKHETAAARLGLLLMGLGAPAVFALPAFMLYWCSQARARDMLSWMDLLATAASFICAYGGLGVYMYGLHRRARRHEDWSAAELSEQALEEHRAAKGAQQAG
ncbi:MAG: hypothetical protein M5U26_29790 [Planctomycetota bacterium]|nr:hypothetical protein [Planctomycetota bacterium]